MSESFDVVVAGSGAGALVAALRAAASGLSVLVVEKEHAYGGTSALSGGVVWLPNNREVRDEDSPEAAMAYLHSICGGEAREDKLVAYVASAPEMAEFLEELGVHLDSVKGWPDYYSSNPGAGTGRSMVARELDAAELGDAIFTLRDQTFSFRLFDRYALDLAEANALATRPPGWKWTAFKVIARYWLDWPWRSKTRRDRRLTMGAALVGALRRAVDRKGIPVWLNTGLQSLTYEGGRVSGAVLARNGRAITVAARRGVVIATGGFEQDQQLRDRHWPVPTRVKWSHTPTGGNTGDGFRAATAIGAASEFLEYGWWAQSTQLPSLTVPNLVNTYQMFFDKHHPNSMCVNQSGKRFVNECCSYDQFGQAMIADYRKSEGGNVPCWLIFDATYRRHYTCGGIMPSTVMPDRKIPPAWWDSYIYRADTIAGLAGKLLMDPQILASEVARMNDFARAGKDRDFDRGGTEYEVFNAGDPRVKPNPCLGPIDRAPFYAVRVDLGDVGNKGGLKTNPQAQVLDAQDRPIPGLYAIGNAAGSPFANAYPGGGGTLGPATVFGFRAASHMAQRND